MESPVTGHCADKKEERKDKLRRIVLSLGSFGAFIWFLVRVIPKPSRAQYPCMKASAPLAAYFVTSFLLPLSSMPLFSNGKNPRTKMLITILSLILGMGVMSGISTMFVQTLQRYGGLTELKDLEGPNAPMGTGVGIYPGRVVWVHDADATDETYDNGGDWYTAERTNLSAVRVMFSKGLQELTGTGQDEEAWNALFMNFNRTRNRGDRPYTAGEKIAVKINLNGTYMGDHCINTSQQLCYVLLEHLIHVVGVKPADISIGDTNVPPNPDMYAMILNDFPGVHFWDRRGRYTQPSGTKEDAIFASDGGKSDPLPQSYIDASYLINVPVLKKHHRAGISLGAKNHFGSVALFNDNGAFDWHYGLPVPEGGARMTNGKNGVYRCLVDFMGHKDLGGKTLLYLVDGLWGSINWGHPAVKWRMSPFNNDWPSSLFLSQDPVAVESVGFDFLFHEFDRTHPSEGKLDPRDDHGPFPRYPGVDDYLHQAADPVYWPKGLVYDPEKDGTPIGSLGVHEHWNNARDKQYSRNLGKNEGIELVLVEDPWKG